MNKGLCKLVCGLYLNTPDLFSFYQSAFIDEYSLHRNAYNEDKWSERMSLEMPVSRLLSCWSEIKSIKSILRNGDTQAVNTSLFQWVNTILEWTITGLQKVSHPSQATTEKHTGIHINNKSQSCPLILPDLLRFWPLASAPAWWMNPPPSGHSTSSPGSCPVCPLSTTHFHNM